MAMSELQQLAQAIIQWSALVLAFLFVVRPLMARVSAAPSYAGADIEIHLAAHYDFSGEEPLYVDMEWLDACGEPVTHFDSATVTDGELQTSGGSTVIPINGFAPMVALGVIGTILPGGAGGQVAACTYATIASLGEGDSGSDPTDLTSLESLLAGGARSGGAGAAHRRAAPAGAGGPRLGGRLGGRALRERDGRHLRHVAADGEQTEQVFQGAALRRGVRMQGKSNPLNSGLKFAPQSFNTPGDEIAPGSDIVRKYFQHGC